MTDEEVRFQAKNLKQVLDENWAFIAERDGETLGTALTLPDINQVLKKMNGRLLPFGWLRFLLGRRKIDRVRVFALGVKPSISTPESPRASTSCTSNPPSGRRRRPAIRVDPGDERADEPRHGGNGRRDRQALPALREVATALVGAHQLGLGQHVALHGLLELLPGSTGLEVQESVSSA